MIFHLVLILAILVTVTTLAFLLSFCESKIIARGQQRLGPNRAGGWGFFHEFAVFRRAMSKEGIDSAVVTGFTPALGFCIVFLLPYIFLLALMYPAYGFQLAVGGFPALLLLLMISLLIDDLFAFAFIDSSLRLRRRRALLITSLGITILLLSCLVPLLRIESGTLAEIADSQKGFPYLAILRSPFLLLAGALAYVSTFYIIPSAPVSDSDESVFSGARHTLHALTRFLWIVGVFGLWVTLFLGGGIDAEISAVSLFSFLFKVFFVSLAFIWLRRSMPLMRIEDSLEFGFKRLLPLCGIALLGELVWLMVFRS